MKNKFIFFVLLLINLSVFAQVGIGTTTPKAIFDIESSNSGILIPRVDLDDVTTPAPVSSPVEGMLIYNKTGDEAHGFYLWNGTEWNLLTTYKSNTWPAFNVYNNSGGNQSTNGIFNATVKLFDQGNNFNLTTDKFTVPVKGIYQFNWTAYSNNSGGRAFLKVDGDDAMQTNGNGKTISITLSLNKGQKVWVTGKAAYTLYWYGAYKHNAFSGFLVRAN